MYIYFTILFNKLTLLNMYQSLSKEVFLFQVKIIPGFFFKYRPGGKGLRPGISGGKPPGDYARSEGGGKVLDKKKFFCRENFFCQEQSKSYTKRNSFS